MSAAQLLDLFLHFLALSLLAIGGAITTAPEMQRYLVTQQHWLSDTDFTNSVALAQAAPGPNILFVAVLGWNVAGALGAFAALAGIMLPSTTLVMLATRWAREHKQTLGVRAFTAGMAPLTLGLLIATGWLLAAPYVALATAFSTIETDLAIKQGVINVQRLLMDSHDFQATGGGTIGFDQILNLTMNLNLSQDLSQKIAGASPVAKLAMKEGRLSLPLIITGTAQAPSYGLDMKGMTGKVQEQVKEKVKEAIGELLKGSTKPEDLKQKGQDLLKGFLR